MLLINSIFKLLHKLRISITLFNTRNKFGAIKISIRYLTLSGYYMKHYLQMLLINCI